MPVMSPVFYTPGSDLLTGAVQVRVPRGTMKVVWGPAAAADTATGVLVSHFPDKSVVIEGTFGTSTVTIQGSNDSTDGTNGVWVVLVDPQGTAISKTANAVEQILENPLWIRPTFGAGTGSALNVTMTCTTPRG